MDISKMRKNNIANLSASAIQRSARADALALSVTISSSIRCSVSTVELERSTVTACDIVESGRSETARKVENASIVEAAMKSRATERKSISQAYCVSQ